MAYNNSSKKTVYHVADSPATWKKDPRTQSVEVWGWAGGGGIATVANSGAGGNGADGLVIIVEHF
jgi:hypothetical protein